MTRFVAIILALIAFFGASAADKTPKDIVDQLFAGMLAGDGAAISALVVEGAKLDRLQKDGTLKQGDFTGWITWVDSQNAGDADEQVFNVTTLQMSPELATVWAPFELHYKGKLAGCGVNQFTLAKSNDGWRILYGIDMPHDGDCATFRANFAS
ncbi:MAG: nuclear transport factor 2 family protein [Kordiimonadaceae bacterium]|nr:nuclear transport factor 2 family protein [Kordiimonadaceae bacterium]